MSDLTAVVAIDFGTTNIGFAFSHFHFNEIYTTGIDGINERILNTVLLNEHDKIDCLGGKAKRKYIALAEKDQHEKWYLFEGYKTTLHTTKRLTRDLCINDVLGRPKPAIIIFSEVIKYIKEKAENILHQSLTDIKDTNIKWVLTVPAIWSDSAKQFMREAGNSAGIPSEQLSFVLEPEAASLFCMEQPMVNVSSEDTGATVMRLSHGEKYILADLGGGTADFSVHEILKDRNIREIHRAVGEIAGGRNVSIAFEQLIIRLFGGPAWNKFTTGCVDEYLDLMTDFETKKREFEDIGDFRPHGCSDISIRVPGHLRDVVKEEYNKADVDVILKQTPYSDRIWLENDKLKLKSTVMKELFEGTVVTIIKQVNTLLQEMNNIGQTISLVIIVGGFSESKYVRSRVKSSVEGVRVIYPPEGSLAVMKGAVMMGFKPKCIVERRSKYTYGFGQRTPFVEGKHPEALVCYQDGVKKCKLVFKKVIEKGQVIKCGDTEILFGSKNTFKMESEKHFISRTELYKSSKLDPKYCIQEDDCTIVCEIKKHPPGEGWPDIVQFEYRLTVGETELKLEVRNKETGNVYQTDCDFL